MYPTIGILIWEYHKHDNWFRDFIARAIVYFTGMPYTHSAVMFRGITYDSTVWTDVFGKKRSGIRVTIGYPSGKPDFIMVPDVAPDLDQMDRLQWELHVSDVSDRPYNYLKILSLMIVWPTRLFWKWLGWVPFNKDFFGKVCSRYVDKIFFDSHWDLIDDEWEAYTVPGQFVTLKGWHREEIDDRL